MDHIIYCKTYAATLDRLPKHSNNACLTGKEVTNFAIKRVYANIVNVCRGRYIVDLLDGVACVAR